MIILREKYYNEEDELEKANDLILEKAKKHGIKVKSVSDMPPNAAAYYLPKNMKVEIIKNVAKKNGLLNENTDVEALGEEYRKTLKEKNPNITEEKLSKKVEEYKTSIKLLKNSEIGGVHMPKNGKFKNDPFVLGHEVGHAMNERSKNPLRRVLNHTLTKPALHATALTAGYKSGRSDDKDEKRKHNIIGGSSIVSNHLLVPAEEASASQRSIKMLKEAGVNKEYIKKARKYAHKNNMVYINPKEYIKKGNDSIRKKSVRPALVSAGLYATGNVVGRMRKNNKNNKNNDN